LTSAHDGLTDGLPVITTPIEMTGPATITRASLLPFRIAEVSATGSLTLTTAVALTNSSLSGNSALLNGGGLANADTSTGTAPAATFTRSPVSGNAALLSGGGIYNGLRGGMTVTGVSGSPLVITGNFATTNGGGIAANSSTATTLTQTAVTVNLALLTVNTPNNCVGSTPRGPQLHRLTIRHPACDGIPGSSQVYRHG
jgi:predicted outer membrane repeat protein